MELQISKTHFKLLIFLAISQVLKSLWHVEVLTWETMEKTKMWNISKTADSRAKQTKICYSGYNSAHMKVSSDARFLGLGSFSTICKIPNFTIFKLRCSPNFHTIHPNFTLGILFMGQ